VTADCEIEFAPLVGAQFSPLVGAQFSHCNIVLEYVVDRFRQVEYVAKKIVHDVAGAIVDVCTRWHPITFVWRHQIDAICGRNCLLVVPSSNGTRKHSKSATK